MSCCCDSQSACGIFFNQILDFGYSCGSLISEGLGLIRTFQRISAPQSFVAKLHPDCINCFNWAKELVDLFLGLVRTNPLNHFEHFYIYTFVLPLTILMAFSFITDVYFFHYCFVYGLFLILGFGFAAIQYDYAIGLIIIAVPVVIIIIGLLIHKFRDPCHCELCCLDDCNCFAFFFPNKNQKYDKLLENPLLYVTLCFCGPPMLSFYLFMIPIMIDRTRLLNTISTIVGIVMGISILIMLFMYFNIIDIFDCCDCCCKHKSCNCNCNCKCKMRIDNILIFLTYILALLIIPSTNKFLSLMSEKKQKIWTTIVSYIAISILLPIAIFFILIRSNHSLIKNKYKNTQNYFYYIELMDILRQFFYAISAYYDIIWYCFFSEIVWAGFIIYARPYQNESDMYLTIGNCGVLVASNCGTLIAKYQGIQFNLAASIILVLIALLPAIVSMLVFFIKDLDFNYKSEDNKETLEKIGRFIRIVTPIGWLFYGLEIPLIAYLSSQ